MLIPSPPPNASPTVRGLVNVGAQEWTGPKIIALDTGLATDRALTLGTRVANASVAGLFSFLSMRTGIGNTEVEWAKFQRPFNYGESVLTLDQQSQTNTRALNILASPAGIGGIAITSYGGGTLEVNAAQPGSGALFHATNKGVHIQQNSNAYDTTQLMRFTVVTSASIAAAGFGTTPAFDFEHQNAMNVNQPFMRFRVNGSEIGRVLSDGSYNAGSSGFLRSGTSGGVGLGLGGLGVLASSFPMLVGAGWGLSAGVPALQFNSTTVWSPSAGERIATFRHGSVAGTDDRFSIFANGEPEVHTNGSGVILRSPNGTRYRLTVTNLGALSITAV